MLYEKARIPSQTRTRMAPKVKTIRLNCRCGEVVGFFPCRGSSEGKAGDGGGDGPSKVCLAGGNRGDSDIEFGESAVAECPDEMERCILPRRACILSGRFNILRRMSSFDSHICPAMRMPLYPCQKRSPKSPILGSESGRGF